LNAICIRGTVPVVRLAVFDPQVTSQLRDVNKQRESMTPGSEVTSHVNKDGGRRCGGRARDVNKDVGLPNYGRHGAVWNHLATLT